MLGGRPGERRIDHADDRPIGRDPIGVPTAQPGPVGLVGDRPDPPGAQVGRQEGGRRLGDDPGHAPTLQSADQRPKRAFPMGVGPEVRLGQTPAAEQDQKRRPSDPGRPEPKSNRQQPRQGRPDRQQVADRRAVETASLDPMQQERQADQQGQHHGRSRRTDAPKRPEPLPGESVPNRQARQQGQHHDRDDRTDRFQNGRDPGPNRLGKRHTLAKQRTDARPRPAADDEVGRLGQRDRRPVDPPGGPDPGRQRRLKLRPASRRPDLVNQHRQLGQDRPDREPGRPRQQAEGPPTRPRRPGQTAHQGEHPQHRQRLRQGPEPINHADRALRRLEIHMGTQGHQPNHGRRQPDPDPGGPGPIEPAARPGPPGFAEVPTVPADRPVNQQGRQGDPGQRVQERPQGQQGPPADLPAEPQRPRPGPDHRPVHQDRRDHPGQKLDVAAPGDDAPGREKGRAGDRQERGQMAGPRVSPAIPGQKLKARQQAAKQPGGHRHGARRRPPQPDEPGRDIRLDRPHVPLTIKKNRPATAGGDVLGHQADDRLVVVEDPLDPVHQRPADRQRRQHPGDRRQARSNPPITSSSADHGAPRTARNDPEGNSRMRPAHPVGKIHAGRITEQIPDNRHDRCKGKFVCASIVGRDRAARPCRKKRATGGTLVARRRSKPAGGTPVARAEEDRGRDARGTFFIKISRL